MLKTCAKSVASAFKEIDYYSRSVTLHLKRQEKFSTPMGQVSSLAIIGFTIASFALLTKDLYEQKAPNIVSKVQSERNPEVNKIKFILKMFNLNPSTFYLAMALGDELGKLIQNTDEKQYYTPIVQFLKIKNEIVDGVVKQVSTNITLNLIPCIQANVDLRYVQGIDKSQQLQALCIDDQQWLSMQDETYVGGTPQSETFIFGVLLIYPCDRIKFNNCATEVETREKLLKGYVSIAYADRLLDQSKAGDPYSYTSRTLLKSIGYDTETNIQISLRHSYLESITNFFYFQPEVEEYHVLQQVGEVVTTLPKNFPGSAFVNLNFILDDKVERYTRTYRTFFDILGSVGGIHNFLSIFFGLIMGPLTKLAQQITIINEIYDIQDEKKPQQPVNKVTSQGQPPKIANDPESILKLLQQKKKRKLRYRCHQLVLLKICGDKQRLVGTGSEQLSQQLDIATILLRLHDIEKLKLLLLTDDQLRLFKYLPKPKLIGTLGPQSQSKIVPAPPSDQQGISQTVKSYKSLMESRNKKDQRLLNMINEDFVPNIQVVQVNEQLKEAPKEVAFITIQSPRIDEEIDHEKKPMVEKK